MHINVRQAVAGVFAGGPARDMVLGNAKEKSQRQDVIAMPLEGVKGSVCGAV